MTRWFRAWAKYENESSAVVIDADDHHDAAEKFCDRSDDFEVQEREVFVREIVDNPDELDEDEERKRGDVHHFDATAEYDKYWSVCDHWEPPPEPEEVIAARKANFERVRAEYRVCEEHNAAVLAVAKVGQVIAAAAELRERLAPMIDREIAAAVAAERAKVRAEVERLYADVDVVNDTASDSLLCVRDWLDARSKGEASR